MLDWLFEHLTAGRDHLSLTVSSAYDDKGAIRPAAHKLLTAFGVQARVNAFDANQTMLAGAWVGAAGARGGPGAGRGWVKGGPNRCHSRPIYHDN